MTACVDAPTEAEPSSLQTLPDPQGLPATVGRFEVRQGDQGAAGGGDRCELINQTRPITGMSPAPGRAAMPGGEVRLFGFEALYDASVQQPTSQQYQTVGQWHNSTAAGGCPASSPLKIAVVGPSGAKRLEVHEQQCLLGITTPRRVLFSTPLVTDVWNQWVFEIKWSTDPLLGYVRIWHDGNLVASPGCETDGRCMVATQYSAASGVAVRNHFKLGNYRDKTIEAPTAVYYRGTWIGRPGDGAAPGSGGSPRSPTRPPAAPVLPKVANRWALSSLSALLDLDTFPPAWWGGDHGPGVVAR